VTEIVVIDNGPDPSLRAQVEATPRARYLFEAQASSYAARNRGIGASAAELLAFTDADCVPTREWLANGVRRLVSAPEVDVLGGRVRVIPKDPLHPTAIELFEMRYALPQERLISSAGFAVTANLMTRREVFRRVGEFDSTLRSGGDLEWGHRVTAAGLQIAFCEEAVVEHPARDRLSQVLARARRVAGGQYRLSRAHPWELVAQTVRSLLRPARDLVFSPSAGYSAAARLRVFPVDVCFQLVKVLELGRLMLGGTPQR
jgi:cellulose synthase/poly-beta-1,6-N-acetylglucosamine synthase-like glycosyltransferase